MYYSKICPDCRFHRSAAKRNDQLLDLFHGTYFASTDHRLRCENLHQKKVHTTRSERTWRTVRWYRNYNDLVCDGTCKTARMVPDSSARTSSCESRNPVSGRRVRRRVVHTSRAGPENLTARHISYARMLGIARRQLGPGAVARVRGAFAGMGRNSITRRVPEDRKYARRF